MSKLMTMIITLPTPRTKNMLRMRVDMKQKIWINSSCDVRFLSEKVTVVPATVVFRKRNSCRHAKWNASGRKSIGGVPDFLQMPSRQLAASQIGSGLGEIDWRGASFFTNAIPTVGGTPNWMRIGGNRLAGRQIFHESLPDSWRRLRLLLLRFPISCQ